MSDFRKVKCSCHRSQITMCDFFEDGGKKKVSCYDHRELPICRHRNDDDECCRPDTEEAASREG